MAPRKPRKIGRAPQAETRVRRALDQLIKTVNDMIDGGILVLGGDGKTVLNPDYIRSNSKTPIIFEECYELGMGNPGPRGPRGPQGAQGPPGPGGIGSGGGAKVIQDVVNCLMNSGPEFGRVNESRLQLSDTTLRNVTTAKHGLAPKLPNDATLYLDGTGTYSAPGGGGSGTTAAYARRAPFYPPFTPSGDDDEFDDGSFTGWTLVEPSAALVFTEGNDVLSVYHPGGDTSGHIRGVVKARTIAANDWVEAYMFNRSRAVNFAVSGVMMSDGATHGAGNQVVWFFSNIGNLELQSRVGYTSAGTASGFTMDNDLPTSPGCIIRLMYLGSNTWRGYLSLDGVGYWNVTGDLSRTMTPTHAGLVFSTFGGVNPYLTTVRYVRFGSGTP